MLDLGRALMPGFFPSLSSSSSAIAPPAPEFGPLVLFSEFEEALLDESDQALEVEG